MKRIYIKYNPYKLETLVMVDGKNPKENSELNVGDKRLQEWVEELPRILVDEYNSSVYQIIFHGTKLDFDDIVSVFENTDFEDVKFDCIFEKGQDVEDKEFKIKKIFEEIQNGPFEELKSEDMKKAFLQAQNQEFPINVVATMSAGKSTLINALLGKKIMPASQEACTATISEIQDNDDDIFKAKAFDKKGNLYATSNDLDLDTMKDWNNNEKISKIEIQGNIPFVKADNVRLILMDTPGPNNSRDESHKETTMRTLQESSKTLILYVLNATQFAVNDDNKLLNMVADSMKVGGKQSKDRFIFVVNKLDDFNPEEDNVESTLNKVRKYLEDKGIENPNVYPASALVALNIRTILRNERIDGDTRRLSRECRGPVNKIWDMMEDEQLHLEQYTLQYASSSLKNSIEYQLEIAQDLYENENPSEGMKQLGLIYSGIIPIEEAIKIYTEKYSKTLKIKNIVDTFQKKLESQQYFTKLQKNITENKKEQEKIIEKINVIKEKLNDGKNAKSFKAEIDAIDYKKEMKTATTKILLKAQNKIEEIIDDNRGSDIPVKAAKEYIEYLAKEAEFIQTKVKVDLENIINIQIKKDAENILKKYKERLKNLTKELEIDNSLNIDIFSIVEGDLSDLNNSEQLIDSLSVVKKQVKVGEKEVSDSKWYNPFSWFSSHWEDVYETKNYYKLEELSFKFFAPFQKKLKENGENAITFANMQSLYIKDKFKNEFDKLDKLIEDKMNELEICTLDEKNKVKIIAKLEQDLKWLDKMSDKVNAILEI